MSLNPPDPRALAVCRILLGCVVATNTFEVAATMLRVEDGRLGVPGVLDLPINETTIWVWALSGVVAGLMLALGVVTGLAAAAAAVLGVIALLWEQQNYSNHLWLTTLLATYLVFAKSDARWSVRALLLGRRESVPAWPSLLMVTQLSVCYVFAGLSKLNPWWLAGDELRPSLHLTLPSAGYPLMAVVVIATEVFIGLGIWFGRTRWLALATGVLLHVGIIALMRQPLTLVAFSLACLAVYPLVFTAPYVGGRRKATSLQSEEVAATQRSSVT